VARVVPVATVARPVVARQALMATEATGARVVPVATPTSADSWVVKVLHRSPPIPIQPVYLPELKLPVATVEPEARPVPVARVAPQALPVQVERPLSNMWEVLSVIQSVVPIHPTTGTPKLPEKQMVSATAQTPRV